MWAAPLNSWREVWWRHSRDRGKDVTTDDVIADRLFVFCPYLSHEMVTKRICFQTQTFLIHSHLWYCCKPRGAKVGCVPKGRGVTHSSRRYERQYILPETKSELKTSLRALYIIYLSDWLSAVQKQYSQIGEFIHPNFFNIPLRRNRWRIFQFVCQQQLATPPPLLERHMWWGGGVHCCRICQPWPACATLDWRLPITTIPICR